MVDLRRVGNVLYYEYTVATIDYALETDAFTVARADIYASDHPNRLSLVIVVNERQLAEERMFLQDAIAEARRVLDDLITENRPSVEHLTADTTWMFNVRGQRLR
jgi:hypothetical protein